MSENKEKSDHTSNASPSDCEEEDYDYDVNGEMDVDNLEEDDEKLFIKDKKTQIEPDSHSSTVVDSDSEENSNSKAESDEKLKAKEANDAESTNEQKSNEETTAAEIEAEKQKELAKSLEETNQVLAELWGNINYGIVLAFLEKFATHLSLNDLTFKNLDCYLSNTRTLNRKLIDLHLKLLKNLPMGKHAKKDKWEYYLAKFVKRFSSADSQLIENGAYLTCKVSVKVKCMKNLLESQFDENPKFKQILAEQITDPNFLREQPLGRDKSGFYYMCYIDKDFSVRLFSYDSAVTDAEKTWKLVSMEVETLKRFVEELNAEPDLVKLRACKRYLQNLAIAEKALKLKQLELEKEANKEADTDMASKEKTEEQSSANVDEKKLPLVEQVKSMEEKVESIETKVESDEIKEENDEIKKEESLEIKNEKETSPKDEPQVKEETENLVEVPKTEVKNEKEAAEENKDEETVQKEGDAVEATEETETPIALRKSTRSSARKAQEIIVKPVVTVTPKKTPSKATLVQPKKDETPVKKTQQRNN